MRLAPHDQLTLLVLPSRPARQTLGDDFLCELIELRFALLQRPLDLGFDLGKRVTADPRVDEISGLYERRGRQADWNVENPILHLSVLPDQNHHGALGLEPYEFDMFEPRIRFGGEHHPGGAA